MLKHAKVFQINKNLDIVRWNFVPLLFRGILRYTATHWNGQIKMGLRKMNFKTVVKLKLTNFCTDELAYMNILKLLLNFVIYSWIYNTVSQWYIRYRLNATHHHQNKWVNTIVAGMQEADAIWILKQKQN